MDIDHSRRKLTGGHRPVEQSRHARAVQAGIADLLWQGKGRVAQLHRQRVCELAKPTVGDVELPQVAGIAGIIKDQEHPLAVRRELGMIVYTQRDLGGNDRAAIKLQCSQLGHGAVANHAGQPVAVRVPGRRFFVPLALGQPTDLACRHLVETNFEPPAGVGSESEVCAIGRPARIFGADGTIVRAHDARLTSLRGHDVRPVILPLGLGDDGQPVTAWRPCYFPVGMRRAEHQARLTTG